uniref:Uncharacterized protein n=1 Tax=Parascaris univalens TaxID=6257 RepID=A0A915AQQ2_PARUN
MIVERALFKMGQRRANVNSRPSLCIRCHFAHLYHAPRCLSNIFQSVSLLIVYTYDQQWLHLQFNYLSLHCRGGNDDETMSQGGGGGGEGVWFPENKISHDVFPHLNWITALINDRVMIRA